MRKLAAVCLFSALLLTRASNALVHVTQPFAGQTTGYGATFTATGESNTCRAGMASIGIYVDGELKHTNPGASLDTTLQLPEGSHDTTIQAWDLCGGSSKVAIPITVRNQPGVWVNSPDAGSSSGHPVFVASSTTTCDAGVAAMGLYVDHRLVYTQRGNTLNQQVDLSPGKHRAVVQSWDYCGGVYKSKVDLTIVNGRNVIRDLQASPAWKMSGQKRPLWNNCVENPGPDPCAGITYSYLRNVLAPAAGNASQFNLGGTVPYSCVLFWIHLIGAHSSQEMPDEDHSITAASRNFTYDAKFYMSSYDQTYTQALEFDINWFLNSTGIIWGVECRMRGGQEWTLWNNVEKRWDGTGIPCNPNKDDWNRVTISGKRNADNSLTYQTITLNGKTLVINKTMAPFWVPGDWYGITVNYQMDGDERQTAVTSYVDNFSLSYW